MKILFLSWLLATVISPSEWQTDFEKARQQAKEKNVLILLNFSGSDWCGPCIRLRKEVFDSEVFQQVASQSLVLVNADFPRSKKNQLPKDLQKQNESLADKYNSKGKFPYTVIITPEGKLVKAWDGYPNNNSTQFIEQVKAACNASRN